VSRFRQMFIPTGSPPGTLPPVSHEGPFELAGVSAATGPRPPRYRDDNLYGSQPYPEFVAAERRWPYADKLRGLQRGTDAR
jgi:hypothetical protein